MMVTRTRRRKSVCLAAMLFPTAVVSAPAFAEDDERSEDHDPIVVWERAEKLIGKAISDSEGVVGYADVERRPLLRGGELDHGTDFAGHVMPAKADRSRICIFIRSSRV